MRPEIYTENDLKITRHVVSPFAANCYYLVKDNEAILIDPGDNGADLLAELKAARLSLKMVWLTHGHIDHVGGLREIQDSAASVPVYMHPEDLPIVERTALMGDTFGWHVPDPHPPSHMWQDGDSLCWAGFEFFIQSTPGHSPGSVIIIARKNNKSLFAITGDVIFSGSIGRTDLWGGSFEQLENSIRKKVYCLPDHINLYPGHGPATTVGEEKRSNPFVRP